MSTKYKILSICLLLSMHPALFGMEEEEGKWKRVAAWAIAGTGAVTTTFLCIKAFRAASKPSAIYQWAQKSEEASFQSRLPRLTTTDAVDNEWEKTYRFRQKNPDVKSQARALVWFESIYNLCAEKQLKSPEDLATWANHIAEFRKELFAEKE